MNENRPKGNQKHIDLSGRIRIEQGLNNGESFRTIARDLNKDPARYFMDAEIMSALINVLTAERQDAVKFVTTISRDSVKNLLSLHMHVTGVHRKRTA